MHKAQPLCACFLVRLPLIQIYTNGRSIFKSGWRRNKFPELNVVCSFLSFSICRANPQDISPLSLSSGVFDKPKCDRWGCFVNLACWCAPGNVCCVVLCSLMDWNCPVYLRWSLVLRDGAWLLRLYLWESSPLFCTWVNKHLFIWQTFHVPWTLQSMRPTKHKPKKIG